MQQMNRLSAKQHLGSHGGALVPAGCIGSQGIWTALAQQGRSTKDSCRELGTPKMLAEGFGIDTRKFVSLLQTAAAAHHLLSHELPELAGLGMEGLRPACLRPGLAVIHADQLAVVLARPG